VTADAQQAVETAFTDEWGRIVAALIGRTGDWDAGRLPPALRDAGGSAAAPRPARRGCGRYRRALELAGSDAERRFLTERLGEVGEPERPF
jgi:predicted RNA polymerase sigma factor